MHGVQLTPRVMERECQMRCVDDYTVSCTIVQTVPKSAQKNLSAVETKIELDSHADTCVVGEQCLVIHDDNGPVNIYGYYLKSGSKQAFIVNATIAYTEPETVERCNHSSHLTTKMERK